MNYSDWIKEIENEKSVHGKYREKAARVEKRYRLEENSRFNVLWSNVEILHASLYSQTPKPDVQRRHKEQNDLARQCAEVIERALNFSLDQYDFDGVINPAVNNHLVPGLGQVKVIYDVGFQPLPEERIPVDTVSSEDGDEYYLGDEKVEASVDEAGAYIQRSPGETIARQDVWCRVVPWKRFLWSPAKDYEGVWWQAEELFLTEEQVRDTYIIDPKETIPLQYANDADDINKSADREGKLAKVIEVWDRRNRVRCGIILGMDHVLKYRGDGKKPAPDDPYGLQSFWPYPKPLFSNATAGEWVPIPDYLYYQAQAQELETLTKRIDALTAQLRWRGIHDAQFKDLANLSASPDGKFLAVENFGERFGDKGLRAIYAEMPLDGLVTTLKFLHEARDRIKQVIYEITGLSDILRGATDPSETLGAQQMKGQFANVRIGRRQKAVQRFIKDILRIKAEIIAEHFEAEQLSMMTGMEVTPEMSQLLKSDVLRNFSIDIETDSTILVDQTAEQNSRVEVVRAITELITQWAPLVAQAPQLLEILKETTLFLLGGFKAGSALEDTFEKLSDGTTPGVDQLAGFPVGAGAAPLNNAGVVG